MKKLLVFSTLLVALLLCLTSCKHEHSFGEWSVTKNATCTEDGVKTRYCDCGEKQSDTIPFAGHNYADGVCVICDHIKVTQECKHENIEVLPAIQPICTAFGLTEGKKCSDCGIILIPREEVPKLDCVEGDWIVDKVATETEDGARHTECIMCSRHITEEVVPATGVVELVYSITVVTEGGMALSRLPIYIFEFEDGSLGDMVEDGGYAATDDSGKATFTLVDDKEYAAKINLSLPKGYEAQPYYPIISEDMTITVSSSVISDSNLAGVSYQLGSVMHDFTVNSTILVENENGELEFKDEVFTLSEVLKTKKAVLINFWYTNCSWCATEFPYMQRAYEVYGEDIAIIALDPYIEDSYTEIERYQEVHGLTFNLARDELGLARAFNVEGYPTSVMIDRYGVITMIEVGAITNEKTFNVVFDHFAADNYEQKLIGNTNDIIPNGNLSVGDKCPTYSLELVDGSGKVNTKDFKGKIVVINFWGTWCGPCKQELPDLNKLSTEYKDDVVVLTVHTTTNKDMAPAYIAEHFPESDMIFAYDLPLSEHVDMYFNLLGGKSAYPRTLILDENGVIVFTYDGTVDYSRLVEVIENTKK